MIRLFRKIRQTLLKESVNELQELLEQELSLE